MDPLPKISRAPFGLGTASFVIGSIGLLLCPLPILGAPISSLGLIGGVVGCGLIAFGSSSNFRWSAAGAVLSALALSVNLAIAYGPSTESAPREVPQIHSTVPKRTFVPPPRRSPYAPEQNAADGEPRAKSPKGKPQKR